MAAESQFEKRLINQLMRLYPGAIILKNDANDLQGFPDRLMLWRDRWAAFEAKASRSSSIQPNQAFYIDTLNDMSYASFVFPENKDKVLDELQRSFRSHRLARLSQC